MTRIFVDADACPVKNEVLKVAERFDLEVYLVSNQWMRMAVGPKVHKQVVPEGADAADDWIAEHIEIGDVAITSDIPLASRCLEKGADAMGPSGKAFTKDNIGMALAMRELKSHLRETGEDRGFNASFTQRDRSDFLNAIDKTLVRLIRTSR
ncbi:YaiI/YqxD family protein [Kordiimonas aquimaris]|uniref:YaiI/YqxD family protein n=1 Tax=Kordiimonas aquimaris TaxID=707591 RepID=UPI0021D20AE8|nr:YaiI/YqxD family protein [Kordiimonas aquimaris]